MDSINTQPILDLIRKEAEETARKLLEEAQDRAMTIREQSALRVAHLEDETAQKAALDGSRMAERMQRLALLDERKDLLAAKRALIDEAFAQALSALHQLSDGEVEAQILEMVLQNAVGDEQLIPGGINRGFYSQEFIRKANERLVRAGKEGALSDSGETAPDVCGVVLRRMNSETHCTFEAMLEGKKEALELGTAAVLFPDRAE